MSKNHLNPLRYIFVFEIFFSFSKQFQLSSILIHSIFFAEAGVAENQGWCATKVDTHDDYIPHNWGICQPECKPPVSKCNKEFYYFRLKVSRFWICAVLLWKLKISRFAHKLQNSSGGVPQKCVGLLLILVHKWALEKLACHSHDYETPLSFQFQIAEIIEK